MEPGFDVELVEMPVPRSAPTDVSTAFIVGPTEKGPITPRLCLSPDEAREKFGDPTSFSYVADEVDYAFAEGISRVYIGRVVGPGADPASHEFVDATPAPTLAVDAASPGAWGNDLLVAINNSGAAFSIVVTDADGNTLLITPEFATKADAVAWADENDDAKDIIKLRSLAPNTLPVDAVATALAGGDDDIAGITNAEKIAALAGLSKWLGPGQVSVPGDTTVAMAVALVEHAAATNRRAVLDLPDDPDGAVLRAHVAAVAAAVGDQTLRRFGAFFGPWDITPGRIPNTTRKLPPSGRVMGTIARSDAATGNPNLPAAGDNGIARTTIGLTQSYTDDEYTALNRAGCNMSRTLFDGSPIQIYGFRTFVDPDQDKRWVEFSGSRTVMAATSQANAVMAGFAFNQIDGHGHKFADLGGAITGEMLKLFRKEALYGDTPGEAFSVNTGPQVNTPERVQNRELRAIIALRTSPFAEHVVTQIVRRMVTEEV